MCGTGKDGTQKTFTNKCMTMKCAGGPGDSMQYVDGKCEAKEEPVEACMCQENFAPVCGVDADGNKKEFANECHTQVCADGSVKNTQTIFGFFSGGVIEVWLDFLDTCFYFGLSMSPMRCFVYTTLPLDCAFSQRPLEPAGVLLPCIYHVCCLAYRAVTYDIYIYKYMLTCAPT